MNPIDLLLLFASGLLALVSRGMMKRFALRKFGRANEALLEIDFWKASSGEALVRSILFVEILSWLACVLLVAVLASKSFG